MKKYLLYGLGVVAVVIIFAVVVLLANPSVPTIKGDIFSINDWNHPEYIENNMTVIHEGSVVNIMEAEDSLKSEVIVKVKSNVPDTIERYFLVYLVDTVKYQLEDSIVEKKVLNIGKYLYEETSDSVRTLPVYLTDEARELY